MRSFKQSDVRGDYSGLDVIPIDVSVSDYEIGDPAGDHFRGIMVGTAGDVEIVTLTGKTRIIPANCLAVGVVHPVGGTKVLNANTTASEICVVL